MGINRVYLPIGQTILQNSLWSTLKTAIDLYDKNGIDVEFLFGKHTWTTNHEEPIKYTKAVYNFVITYKLQKRSSEILGFE